MQWCVAKPGTLTEQLINNLNYACSIVDCQIISTRGACYSPDNIYNMASVVMNLYYQAEGRNFWNCNFGDSGLVAITDPSEFYLSLLFHYTIIYVLFFCLISNYFCFRQAMEVANMNFVCKA
ncbi:putative glucan endo-1,3-beta-D-glucosidase [Arabidopsis thaliana]|nr:Carbohydrate-binding X8 domain superfamily protein [Arabidopsis thaliana]AEE77423.1 Carbohydrate-binding X8 domain superfamily protein [Arabidopsis thaliana]|eukprot:NP_189465.1 Carbohydrate-binding X8 domain superfamily protein [Arabidopsis thaliana]